jgi:hypothetical protein
MKKTVLIYGSLIGFITSVVLVISMSTFEGGMDYDYGQIFGFSVMILAFISMFFGIRSYKNNVLGGEISFGRALGMGLLITLFACVVYSLTWTVYTEVAKVEFMDDYILMMEKKMVKEGKSATEIQEMKDKNQVYVDMYKNPLLKFLITIIEPLPVGVGLSFIFALILALKRKQDEPEPAV